ncbi:MAG: SIS domain-containing protein [Myxococcota bacterium]
MREFEEFVADYQARLTTALQQLDRGALERVLAALLALVDRDGTLWVAGNGGSASLSDHAACDLAKGTHADGHAPLRAVSLASNAAIVTAIANDLAYDQVYRKQLEIQLRDGDAVLLISASGNSPNVLEACRYARKRGVPTIAFVGFRGGELARLADHVVHVPVENYGISEDVHQALMHILSQFIARQRRA